MALAISITTAAVVGGGSYYYYRQQRRRQRLQNPQDVQFGLGSSLVYADAIAEDDRSTRPNLFWKPPSRSEMLNMLKGLSKDGQAQPTDQGEFDLLVIGGGATGSGVALDAATRGLKVAMVERDDFSAGTSSRSTKLVHGGVRYLEKAFWELDIEQYNLVKEALHERKRFLEIAPYLSQQLPIMIPVYKWWQLPYFWAGCKAYDLLAGKQGLESSYLLTSSKAIEAFPMLKRDKLKGALVYYDGQHNDSRMNVAIALTAISHGAVVSNHVEVTELLKKPGPEGRELICGAKIRDVLTGEEFTVRAKGVVNATGPFTDSILHMETPTSQEIVAPSSGVHIILPKYYSPDHMGLIDPNTSDNRVIFFLPWQGHTIAGTTDSPTQVTENPLPKEEEIQWILNEVRRYLSEDIKVRRGDVLAAWSGIRPLVRDPNAKDTAGLVRSHMLYVSPGKMITIAGGKWTTYRNMAEETVDLAIQEFSLQPRNGCVTTTTKLIGSHGYTENLYVKLVQIFGLDASVARHLARDYGDRAWTVCTMADPTGQRFPLFGNRLSPLHPYIDGEVRYAVRNEYACTVVDVLARRTRLAFVNAQAAKDAIPGITRIMAKELGWNQEQQDKEILEAETFLQAMGLPSSLAHANDTMPLASPAVVATSRQPAPVYEEVSMRYSQGLFHPDELGRYLAIFSEYDRQGTGKIQRQELGNILTTLGLSVPSAQLKAAESQLHVEQLSQLEFEQFLDILGYLKEGMYEATNPAKFKRIPIHRSGGGV
ncbi:mitochondrial glycerol-3-phosphate dehydrogenase [Dispira simplex]|nr:mitochondrial glycerol-3-phosphate dehydrogenase [Dispira simplex]